MPEFDPQEFAQTTERIRTKALEEGRLLHNPPNRELEQLAAREPEVHRTAYGNLVVDSEPMSRAAASASSTLRTP